ncbi:hypothetical protein HDV00_000917, partial [Rhizophlyctis rosea]
DHGILRIEHDANCVTIHIEDEESEYLRHWLIHRLGDSTFPIVDQIRFSRNAGQDLITLWKPQQSALCHVGKRTAMAKFFGSELRVVSARRVNKMGRTKADFVRDSIFDSNALAAMEAAKGTMPGKTNLITLDQLIDEMKRED